MKITKKKQLKELVKRVPPVVNVDIIIQFEIFQHVKDNLSLIYKKINTY